MKFPFLKKNNTLESLPKNFQKDLRPTEEFLHFTKQRFLATYDESDFAMHQATQRSAFALGVKFGIGVLAILAIVGGASAYADTANVSVQNPLYPLKRLGENVQLALTPSTSKAQVQATFAVRRVDEIKQLQATNPTSTLIPSLTNDLAADVSSSLTDSDEASASASTSTSTSTSISENVTVNVTSTDANATNTVHTTSSSSTAVTASSTSKSIEVLCAVLSGRQGLSLLGKQSVFMRLLAKCDPNFIKPTSSTSSSITSGPTDIHVGFRASSTFPAISSTTMNTTTTTASTSASATLKIVPSLIHHASKALDGYSL